MRSAISARRQRRWAIFTSLVGLLFGALAVVFVGAAEAVEETPPLELPPAAEIIPDLVISVPETPSAPEDAAALIAELTSSPAIAWVADDLLSPSAPNLMVAFVDDESSLGPRAVVEAISARENGPDYVISGRDPVDRLIADRVGLGVFWAIALAAVVGATTVSWLMGLARGLLTGIVIAASAAFGAAISNSLSGTFDGTLATTAIPAALAAVVVSGYVLLRLYSWFEAPDGDDPADRIRRSVLSVGIELFLLLAGLLVIAVFLELTGPAASVSTGVLTGALVGATFTLAVAPAALASATPTAAPSDSADPAPLDLRVATDVGTDEARGVGLQGERDDGLIAIPSGRDFPVTVFAGLGLFLLVIGLFAFRQTATAQFFDVEIQQAGGAEAVADGELSSAEGDPTAAIFARFPDRTDQLAKANWLERVSQLPSVARVDTSEGRYQAGAFTEASGLVGSSPEVGAADEAPLYALVVPTSSSRSPQALALVDAITSLDTSITPELAGVPIEARSADARDRSQVWLTILALSIVGGVAVFALIGDFGLVAMNVGLRLVGSAAVVGMYHLLVPEVSGTELQVAVLIVALGMSLFELGYCRRLLASNGIADTDLLLDRALNSEGVAAAAALSLAAVGGLGLLVPDIPMLRRFGILLAVVILVKIVVGMWLLRPAVLGSRAIGHFASKPVMAALDAVKGTSVTSKAEHEAWTDVVNGLLWTEFSFQAEPSAAVIESVFVSDTSLYKKSTEHHANLQKAGLRIVGRHPQLRALKIVSNSAPATMVATVDHPIRQLTDEHGRVVGVRKAERRSVMLWLMMQEDGSYRIADSVELGSTDLGVEVVAEPEPVPVGVPAAHE